MAIVLTLRVISFILILLCLLHTLPIVRRVKHGSCGRVVVEKLQQRALWLSIALISYAITFYLYAPLVQLIDRVVDTNDGLELAFWLVLMLCFGCVRVLLNRDD